MQSLREALGHVEDRAEAPGDGGDDYTTQVMAEAAARAAGAALNPSTLAVVETCVSLWATCLASAIVEPADNRLAGLTPACLALAGRHLALTGNMVLAIVVDGPEVKLLPVSHHDVFGSADPASWVYHVTINGPSTARTVTLPADGVVHFRVGETPSSPWRGTAPLKRSRSTAALGAKVERSFTREFDSWHGRIVALAQDASYDSAKSTAEKMRAERGGHVLSVGSQGGAVSDSGRTYQPARLGPEPTPTMAEARREVGNDILAAYGVPPTLWAERSDGTGAREAWRRFVLSVVMPLGKLIQEELRAKLDDRASVRFDELRALDVDANSRATARRAQAYKTFRDAGMEDGEASRRAGLDASESLPRGQAQTR